MKKYMLIILIGSIFGNEYIDVLKLKDGSVIKGNIVEQSPNKYIKIKSGDNIFVYQMDEIEIITKEENKKIDLIKNKYNSISVGLLTSKNMDLIHFSRDLRLNKNFAFTISAGLPNYISGGLTFQSNYNESGILLNLSSGYEPRGATFTGSAAYQWRMGNSNAFFSLGLAFYSFNLEETMYNYWSGYYYTRTTRQNIGMTVISFDYRF